MAISSFIGNTHLSEELSLLPKVSGREAYIGTMEAGCELLLTRFLGGGAVGNSFYGHFGPAENGELVAKVAESRLSQAQVHHEAWIYNILSTLQGSAIPLLYGLFIGRGLSLLVMQYGGSAISSFSELSCSQRCALSSP